MFFFSSRRRHTRSKRDWSSDVCSSDLIKVEVRVIKDKDGFTDDEGHFTPYNEGKVFTLRVENEDMDMFDVQLAELKQSIGHFIEFDPFEELKGVYFYQQNILTIIISDFK